MQEAKRIAKNTGFLYARLAITAFISLYTTRLILNALGAVDFGLFSVVGGVISMLTFLDNAMAGATMRFMSYAHGEENPEKQKSIFNVSVVLHLIIGLIVVVLFEVVGYFLFDQVLKIDPNRIFAAKMIYHFMVVSTFFTIISVPYDAVINAHENMLLVAILGIFEAFFKLGVAIFITYTANDKLIYYGLLMACISILMMILLRLYCHMKYEEVVFNPKRYFNQHLYKEMTRFAGWNLMGSTSSMIAWYGSPIVLNHFFGTILNAANGIANQLNGQLMVFSNTMQKALNPMITKSEGSGNRELMLKASITGSKISFLLYAIFSIPLFLETPYVLSVWLKNVPDWTIIFIRLSIFRVLIEQITSSFAASINAVGEIRQFNIIKSILSSTEIAILIIAFSLGAPPYCLVLVGILSALLTTVLNIQQTIRFCNLKLKDFLQNLLIRVFLVPFITFLIALIPTLLMHESFLRLLTSTAISSICFILLIYKISLTNSEKIILKILLSKIVRKIK